MYFGRSIVHILRRSPLELLGIITDETLLLLFELNYNLNILEFNFLHISDMSYCLDRELTEDGNHILFV